MNLLLTLAQASPFDHADALAPVDEPVNWGFIIFSLFASVVIQALFGWWAMMRAEEFDANKPLAFVMGFLFLYMGVRMVPILRADRVFNKPYAPRAFPPRTIAAGPQPPYGPPSAAAAPWPAPAPPARADICAACGAPVRAGRKLCMQCGAALPQG